MLQIRVRSFYLVLCLIAAFTTACVAVPPPAETPATTDESQASALSVATDAAAAKQPAIATFTAITGEVVYRPRIALSPDAVVEVELQDISRADAPAVVLGQQRIETGGQQVPIPYVVEYDLSQIDPNGVYALSARITEGGKQTWRNVEIVRVITGGAITDQVQVIVQQVAD